MLPKYAGQYRIPNTEATHLQLERILQSKTFQRAKRLRSLLHYVVTAATSGHSSGQSQTARELFGKGEDFDPSIDPVIRVQFGRLRRALTNYYSTEGSEDSILIEIPSRRYTPVFQESDPPAVDGETRSGEAWSTGKVGSNANGDGPAVDARAFIAVLPFANLTSDPAQDSFCYGLTEEIANGLASLDFVDVVASSSTFQYRDESVDVRAVGDELGVPLILHGSVRMEEGNTRVIAQLARSKDGVAVWSGSFDDKFVGSLDTQKSIAQQVMETLPLKSVEA